MKRTQRVIGILLALTMVALIGAVLSTLMPDGIVRCYLVSVSDLDTIAPDVYVDPTTPESQRQVLLSSLTDGKERIASLYGEYSANPIIIAGHTMDVMRAYGGNSYNRAGRTYLTFAATFIVLGPDGVFSADVLSHELAHAEFSARIGHRNRAKIPNWFDEGLAVQFDDRYSEAEWRSRTDNGRTAPNLNQLGIIKHNDWLGYATAKYHVRLWLDAVGPEGFRAFLQAIQSGDEFQEAFSSIGQTYTTTQ